LRGEGGAPRKNTQKKTPKLKQTLKTTKTTTKTKTTKQKVTFSTGRCRQAQAVGNKRDQGRPCQLPSWFRAGEPSVLWGYE
jgi:hypothetical protein